MASPLHGYTETEYKNAPDHKTTPLNATNLNHSEKGIKDAHTDIKYLYDEIGDVIAPHQEDLIADKNYAVGGQFIYESKLYEVTAAISSGDAITIGTNASLAYNLTKQIREVNAKVDKGYVSVTADGVKTFGQLMDALLPSIDIPKLNHNSKLVIDYGTSMYTYNLFISQPSPKRAYFTTSDIAITNNALRNYLFGFSDAGSKYNTTQINTSSQVSFIDRTQNVLDNGAIMKVIY